jgi:hypothetical protein
MRNIKFLLLAALICVPAIIHAATVINSLPYKITEPGSYVLEGNLTTAGAGIEIKASNVSINLNGYTLSGDSDEIGINALKEINNITVQNGAITGFGQGVTLNGCSQCAIKNLRIFGPSGIFLAGSDCLIEENCVIFRGIATYSVTELTFRAALY